MPPKRALSQVLATTKTKQQNVFKHSTHKCKAPIEYCSTNCTASSASITSSGNSSSIPIHVPVVVQVKGLILYSARMEFPCLFYQQPFFKCELRHAARAFFRAKAKKKTTEEEEEENISEKSNTSIKSRRKATISMGRRTTKLPSLLSQVPPYH